MTELATRLQSARSGLQLSQAYVAQQLGISRSSLSQIEQGNRKVSSDELTIFCKLYHMTADELLLGRSLEMPSQVFARRFSELDEGDKQEILNLMEFKRQMKEQRHR